MNCDSRINSFTEVEIILLKYCLITQYEKLFGKDRIEDIKFYFNMDISGILHGISFIYNIKSGSSDIFLSSLITKLFLMKYISKEEHSKLKISNLKNELEIPHRILKQFSKMRLTYEN